MEYRKLGRTGLEVSRLCLGCMTYGKLPGQDSGPGRHAWALSEADSAPFFRAAIEAGINFFDTANVYSSGGSEEVLGRWMAANVRRESIVLATKAYFVMREEPNGRGLSRKALLFEVEQSLRRLRTDYIDLYQIHRWDDDTPIEETLEALHDLVRAGKVRYIGASSMRAWQFVKAQYVARQNRWARFISMQNHYNLLYREDEREMIAACLHEGVGLIPWSPLARGQLARPLDAAATMRSDTDQVTKRMYSASETADREVRQVLEELAREKGISMATLALAWLLHKPGVVAPIIGASKPGQIEDAVTALSTSLSVEDMNRLEAAYQPHAVVGL